MSRSQDGIGSRPRWMGVVAALALAIALPAVAAEETVGHWIGTSGGAAAWTPAEKSAARPMALRTVAGAPAAATRRALTPQATPGGWPGHPPGAPAANRPLGAPLGVGLAPDGDGTKTSTEFGAGSAIWYEYPPPFELHIPIFGYVYLPLYPYTATGKLFFQHAQGGSFVCSAQSVTSAGTWGAGNGQTVITAGHCCSDGNGSFHSNILFEPGHVNGQAPAGTWSAGHVRVFEDYHQGGELARDVCVLQMNNLAGQRINDAVGALGYGFDVPLPMHVHATGWPAEAPFNGGLMYVVTSSTSETDTTQGFPATHGIGNIMTGGSSGGAWITGFQMVGGANQIVGLNSYRYTTPDRPLQMFSPYFDAEVIGSLLQPSATAPPLP